MVRVTMAMLSMLAMTASAQVPALATGSRLRVEMPGYRRLEGTLISQSADSLVIAADGARLVGVSTASVARIKSTMGKSHGAGAKKGAKIGTLIGAGAGVLVGVVYMNDNTQEFNDPGFDNGAAPVVFGIVGAAEGALYGVLIGAIVGAQDWRTIYERPYRVSLAPAPGGIRMSVSLRY